VRRLVRLVEHTCSCTTARLVHPARYLKRGGDHSCTRILISAQSTHLTSEAEVDLTMSE
jgi:hypothetical protein